MALNFDPSCQDALARAKAAVRPGEQLDAGTLLRAVYYCTPLRTRFPALARYIEELEVSAAPEGVTVPVESALRAVFASLAQAGGAITPLRLLTGLLESAPGRAYLAGRGLSAAEERRLMDTLKLAAQDEPPPEAPFQSLWRHSTERAAALRALSTYGRFLTEGPAVHRGSVEMERPLRSLIRTLSKMGRRNAIIVGYPGTGKSALVYELARRITEGDRLIPPRLCDMDIFELSPAFLRSGASMVGQYDERIKTLIEILKSNPKIILFVDEIHTIFKSGMHEKTPFSEANEAFKTVLGKGEITCIGCTTLAEYRHYLEPDGAFARRFTVIRIEEPRREAALRILRARLPRLVSYYAPLEIPEEMLARAVDLTDEYLPSRFQPDKSIQLLDEACAFCATADPPRTRLDETALWQALEDSIGHAVVRPETLTEAEVLARLKSKILGQDQTMQEIARAFVAGLGKWAKSGAPAGVFLFCGPTGVGKTEAAVLLSKILGGGAEALLRVDCNTLQGSELDAAPAVNRLLGAPPGYIGYARGQGGLLSRIRDIPQAVVLFDEIEKAGPGVARILLQLMDDGRLEDNDGNLLDFRRSFIIFTTNAGCAHAARPSPGFAAPEERSASVNFDIVKADLLARGFGEEFLGRIRHRFVFHSLSPETVVKVVRSQLEALRALAESRGYSLAWAEGLPEYLSAQWQPRFGVRHLTSILRNRVSEQLGVAEAQGELSGISNIFLALLDLGPEVARNLAPGMAARRKENGTLVVALA